MPTTQLDGKIALVTGASSGIGADIARELASRGCSVIIVARREERLLALKNDIESKYAVQVHAIAQDLTAPDAAEILFNKTEGKGLAVDILVNNAGLAIFGYYPEVSWERERKLYELDIISVAHLTRTFLQPMLKRNSGQILLVASIMGMMPVPSFSIYAGAKAFVVNYGKSLGYELRNTGVSVTVASPGTTDSEFFEAAGQPVSYAEKLTMMKSYAVARAAVNAMLKRKPLKVIGFASVFAVLLTKFLPVRLAAWLTYNMMTLAPKK
jgi:uncharacterized protein